MCPRELASWRLVNRLRAGRTCASGARSCRPPTAWTAWAGSAAAATLGPEGWSNCLLSQTTQEHDGRLFDSPALYVALRPVCPAHGMCVFFVRGRKGGVGPMNTTPSTRAGPASWWTSVLGLWVRPSGLVPLVAGVGLSRRYASEVSPVTTQPPLDRRQHPVAGPAMGFRRTRDPSRHESCAR